MLPKDLDVAIMIRNGKVSQSILGFEQIKQLAARWEPATWYLRGLPRQLSRGLAAEEEASGTSALASKQPPLRRIDRALVPVYFPLRCRQMMSPVFIFAVKRSVDALRISL
ncbi:hypothetical protein [Bradyrhizobium sp. UFLA05-112]